MRYARFKHTNPYNIITFLNALFAELLRINYILITIILDRWLRTSLTL